MEKCDVCNHQIEYEICVSCKNYHYKARYCSGFCPIDEEPTDFDYYDNSGRIQCYGCAMKEWMKTKEDEEKNAPEE